MQEQKTSPAPVSAVGLVDTAKTAGNEQGKSKISAIKAKIEKSINENSFGFKQMDAKPIAPKEDRKFVNPF